MSKGQTFLQKYIQRPLGGLVDAATLGYTDFDKKGDDKVQKGIKRGIAGFGDILTQNSTSISFIHKLIYFEVVNPMNFSYF